MADDAIVSGEGAFRAAPIEERRFDERLMTPARLFELGNVPVRVQRDERGVIVACDVCEGQIVALAPSPRAGRRRVEAMTPQQQQTARLEAEIWGPVWSLDARQLLADIVRHQVMRHDVALSGASGKDNEHG